MTKYYYAVKEGRMPGVYKTWEDCEKQVKGYSGAIYKKFPSYEEAFQFTNPNQIVKKNINDIKDKGHEEKETHTEEGSEEENLIQQEELIHGEAIAYVDGSFDLENLTYSYGVVFITKDSKRTYSGREDNMELAQMRNVSGELRGAMVAMEIALEEKIKRLYLHFDYTGIRDWAEGNWKTNREGTKRYKKFYDGIKDQLDVKFIKVRAHAGIEYNEEADRLAKEAIIE